MPLLPLLALLVSAELPSAQAPARRLAVLVGANDAPAGRQTLRFAHRDAQLMQDALLRVGGVAAADMVLLLDPKPAEVLAALERLSAVARAEPRETVLYFYYSGHADESLLYPGGEALHIDAVRDALVKGGATVRVGIFDACRGGSWTRAKGLTIAPPVELRPAWALASEGTVLFASSSGLEEAHESDQLEGSFFTHHLIGGLLGAADTSGDGAVTATEAFAYAQAQTVRDSARASVEPQHPSFELNLHGRKDLVLAQLPTGASTLAVEQAAGPLQVVELPLGLVLLELPEGKRSSKLSVAPGQYLIRRVGDGGVVTAREVRVAPGETTTIEESSLVLVGNSQLERKGDGPIPRTEETILPAHTLGVGLSLGVEYSPGWRSAGDGTFRLEGFDTSPALRLSLAWAPRDWLEISFLTPGVSVMLGTRHEDEVLLSAGLDAFGYGNTTGVFLSPTASVGYRHWLSGHTSLAANARFGVDMSGGEIGSAAIGGGILMTHTIRDTVSFNFGVGVSGWPSAPATFSFGSGRLGQHNFPLVQVHVSPAWTLDFDAQVQLFASPGVLTSQRYLGGFTYVW